MIAEQAEVLTEPCPLRKRINGLARRIEELQKAMQYGKNERAPVRSDDREDPEIEKTIHARLATLDEDRKTVVDAREALAAIRRKLKQPKPA